MNDKYFIFTDADLDGSCSYLCVSWLLGNVNLDYKVTTVKNFENDFTEWSSQNSIESYKKVFILDINTTKFKHLIDKPNVIIVDHHADHTPETYQHAINILKVTTSTVDLLRNTLLKSYKFTDEQRRLIDIVDDYDSYTLKYPQSILLNTLFWQFKGDRLAQFVSGFSQGFIDFNAQQKKIIYLQLKKLQDHLQSNPVFSLKDNNITIGSIFGDFAINELADHVLKKVKADVSIVVNTRLKRIYLRRNKQSNVNLGKVAEQLTGVIGEGHDNACSVPITDLFIENTKKFTVYEG